MSKTMKNKHRAAPFLILGVATFLHCGSDFSAAFYCGDIRDDKICGEFDASFLPLKDQLLTNCRKDTSAIAGDGECPRQDAVGTCVATIQDAACGTSSCQTRTVFYQPLPSNTTVDNLRTLCEQQGGRFSAL